MDSRCLKLYSAFSISKNLANVRWPIFVELNSKGLYQSLEKVQESCFFVCSHPRQKVKLCILTMQSCNDGLEKYKNAWCKSQVVFFFTLNQLFFFPFSFLPFKQQKRRLLRKRQLKSEVALFHKLNRDYSISLNLSNVWHFFFWRWILTGCIDCFANLNLPFFCRSRSRQRRRCLSSQGTTSHRI